MIRALSIVGAVAAFAVTALPASAQGVVLTEVITKPKPRAVVGTLGAGKDRGWLKARPKSPQSGASGLMETNGEQMFLRSKAKVPRPGGGITAILLGTLGVAG